MWFRCPGSEVALQALTQRKVDLAFRVYQALLGAAADGEAAQAMDTDSQVHQTLLLDCWQAHKHAVAVLLLLDTALLLGRCVKVQEGVVVSKGACGLSAAVCEGTCQLACKPYFLLLLVRALCLLPACKASLPG